MSIIADRKWWFMLIGAGALIACGSAANSDDFAGAFGTDTAEDAGTTSTPNGGSDGTTPANVGSATNSSESGIIVVHASRNLPAFRLCLPGHSDLLPLPYDQLMPNSNVVGVDVGAAVHLPSIQQLTTNGSGASGSGTTPSYDAGTTAVDSGTSENDGGEGGVADAGTPPVVDAGPLPPEAIYVIDEKVARQFYPAGVDASTWPDCAVLVSVLQSNGLEGAGLYTVLNASSTPPVSTLDNDNGVSLLVLEGCLPDPTLDQAACGSTYNPTTGNLSYRIVLGLDQPAANGDAGPGFSFQAIQLSPRVDSDLQNGKPVTLAFGSLKDLTPGVSVGGTGSPPLAFGTPVPSNADGPVTVPFTPSSLGDYDGYGFTLTAGTSDGLSQSLATIQAQSSPTDLPQTFYVLPSNFVVLIVGDSQVAATANGPGASLHLLAVPVRNPDADAGAPSSGATSTTDGG